MVVLGILISAPLIPTLPSILGRVVLTPPASVGLPIILNHEATHGIGDELGIVKGEQSEEFIKGFSTGLSIYMRSLGIEPDFSQIPEEKV